MVLTKAEAERNLKIARQNLSDKKAQIRKARKKSDFRGVTISDQFSIGRSGLKSFRKESILRKRVALKDLGLFRSELPGLQTQINLRQSELDFLNIGDL